MWDTQQICLNGHLITTGYYRKKKQRREYCGVCGESTIHKCPECGSEIPGGYYSILGVLKDKGKGVPFHCSACGKPYPWTQRKSEVVLEKLRHPVRDPVTIVELVCNRFHLVARQLLHRHAKRETIVVKDEYDLQDSLHGLQRIFFDDIRTEEWTPSYAGGCSRMDFFLKSQSLVLETKRARKGLEAKAIGDQLIIDIDRYKKHPDCRILFCFVYDPESLLRNPTGIERDLSRKGDEFVTRVLIAPKGL